MPDAGRNLLDGAVQRSEGLPVKQSADVEVRAPLLERARSREPNIDVMQTTPMRGEADSVLRLVESCSCFRPSVQRSHSAANGAPQGSSVRAAQYRPGGWWVQDRVRAWPPGGKRRSTAAMRCWTAPRMSDRECPTLTRATTLRGRQAARGQSRVREPRCWHVRHTRAVQCQSTERADARVSRQQARTFQTSTIRR
jgi:hypothetical protein